MEPSEASQGGLGARLDSWKEIAAYLGRDARTAQRWEKQEGLPVRRHAHQAQASIYAYTAELDAWRDRRGSAAENPLPAEISRRPRWLAWPAGVTLALTLATTGSHGVPWPLAQERAWVLIDGFENRTGESIFDGAVQAAFERELGNSELVSVAPRERVEDALRLMKKPTGAVLTTELAREVCLRDGGIRVLVTGRSEKLGSTYVLSARIMDPFGNRTLASDSETATAQDQVWPAVRRLSNWVRESLGEATERIDLSNQKLEKVTTPSLAALRLFTEADSAMRHQQLALAAIFARQALAEDPDFASARLWLAWALYRRGDPAWKPELEKAVSLLSTVSERERYFILGSRELMADHAERALAPLEALIGRYPDHLWAYANLQNAYRRLGRWEQAGDVAARLADAKPMDPYANAFAALWNQNIDLAKARPYARQALELHGEWESTYPYLAVNTLLFHAHDLWMQDDARGALAEIDRIAGRPQDWSEPKLLRQMATTSIAGFYITLGKFNSSQKLLESQPESLQVGMAKIAYFKGQRPELLPEGWESHAPTLPSYMVKEASVWRGRNQEAAQELKSEFESSYRQRKPETHEIADQLATALERSGDQRKALDMLEAEAATRLWIVPAATFPYGAFWLRGQARLAEYYHRSGREAEARKIDARLRKLMSVADPDHPILRQLNRR